MIVQLPDGNQAEFPDDMPQEQIESVLSQQFPSEQNPSEDGGVYTVSEEQFQLAPELDPQIQAQKGLETQQILGRPTDPSFDTSGLEPWEHVGGVAAGAKRDPKFLDTLDMINTGVHRGVTHFTLGLMSMLPFGEKYQRALKKYDVEVEAEQQKNIKTYDSIAPFVGEIGGELLATAPVGGALAKLGSKSLSLIGGEAILPGVINTALPKGTRLLGGYGTSAVGGAGLLAGTEALRYQGQQFDPSQAMETFKDTMSSPAAYLFPAAATATGRYMEKSRDFQKVIDQGIDVLPRDLKEKGVGRTLSYLFYDSLGMLTPLGRRAEQLQNIGSSIKSVIRSISATSEAMTSSDLKNYASKNLQRGLKKLEAKGTLLWENGGFKKAVINNYDEILPDINNALRIIREGKLPTYGRAEALIQEEASKLVPQQTKKVTSNLVDMYGSKFEKLLTIPQKGKITLEDVKNIFGIIGDAASDAFRLGGGTMTGLGRDLSSIRKSIMEKAKANLNETQLRNFKTAQEFTKNQYELEDAIPLIKDALVDEISANKIIEGIMKDSVTFDKSKAMGIMSEKGQLATKGAIVAKALEQSSTDAGVDLTKFLNKVAPAEGVSNAEKILGREYDYVKGLAKHLSAINEARRIGNFGKFALGTGAVAATALGLTGSLQLGDFKLVAAYPAMVFAANHPVLKRLLGYSTKKLSDSTYKHLTNKIQDIFTRAGYMYNEDGSLSEGEK